MGCWLLAHEVGAGMLYEAGAGRKWQGAELSATQVSEGWDGFSLLLALSFPGEHLEKIIPLIVQYSNVDDDELREYCFQAFESFVRRCPKEMDPHISSVMALCLKYITFDPNYNYDNEEEEEEMMETENGEDEEQGACL